MLTRSAASISFRLASGLPASSANVEAARWPPPSCREVRIEVADAHGEPSSPACRRRKTISEGSNGPLGMTMRLDMPQSSEAKGVAGERVGILGTRLSERGASGQFQRYPTVVMIKFRFLLPLFGLALALSCNGRSRRASGRRTPRGRFNQQAVDLYAMALRKRPGRVDAIGRRHGLRGGRP